MTLVTLARDLAHGSLSPDAVFRFGEGTYPLVDDHELVRAGIRGLFNGNFTICGEGSNGQEAIDRTIALEPENDQVDVSMPVLNGLKPLAKYAVSLLRRKFCSYRCTIPQRWKTSEERLVPMASCQKPVRLNNCKSRRPIDESPEARMTAG